MDSKKPHPFINGQFEWNEVFNKLQFVSNEIIVPDFVQVQYKAKTPELKRTIYDIEFKDNIDLTDKINFKRRFRRRIKQNEVNIIILQDIKDIVFFTADPKNLSRDIIVLMHNPYVDTFLRVLILYFQFFLQTWNTLRDQREDLKTKIKHPVMKEAERKIRDDLSDLRVLISRYYFTLLAGDHIEDGKRKKKKQIMLGEQDRRLCEYLVKISARVVWHALHKPQLSTIEREMNRLARSDHFNIFEHQRIQQSRLMPTYNTYEKSVLYGLQNLQQRRLVAKSAAANEIIYGKQDHRILAIGQVEFPPSDERVQYFEKMLLVPEEDFDKNNIRIGILGLPRDNFDIILKQKRRKAQDDTDSVGSLNFGMEIPPATPYSLDKVPKEYPKKPPKYPPINRKEISRHQCKLWLDRQANLYQPETTVKEYTESVQSIIFN